MEVGMFNIGDKVNHSQGQGVIVYGPFQGLSNFEPRYLIKKEGGEHFTGGESYLTRVPKFEVGQKVTFTYSPYGEVFEIAAGPFPAEEGKPLYVLKDRDGVHDTSYEHYMVPVVE
jgi:hypothetical protein